MTIKKDRLDLYPSIGNMEFSSKKTLLKLFDFPCLA